MRKKTKNTRIKQSVKQNVVVKVNTARQNPLKSYSLPTPIYHVGKGIGNSMPTDYQLGMLELERQRFYRLAERNPAHALNYRNQGDAYGRQILQSLERNAQLNRFDAWQPRAFGNAIYDLDPQIRDVDNGLPLRPVHLQSANQSRYTTPSEVPSTPVSSIGDPETLMENVAKDLGVGAGGSLTPPPNISPEFKRPSKSPDYYRPSPDLPTEPPSPTPPQYE